MSYSTFCDKFTKEKALDKTNLFFGLIHEPIMQLNYGQWLICLSINLFAVLYVHIFGSEINLNLNLNLNLIYVGAKPRSLEPAWVMPEGHHPSRVAKSGPVGFGPEGPKPNRPRA